MTAMWLSVDTLRGVRDEGGKQRVAASAMQGISWCGRKARIGVMRVGIREGRDMS
jgi:hypothetical protein